MIGSTIDTSGNVGTAVESNGHGSAVYLHFDGGASALNMTDSQITAGKAFRAAAAFNEMSAITMTSSTISGGEVSNQGGNVYMIGNADVNIAATLTLNSGAQIKDGSAGNDGGNVYANNLCAITLESGAAVSGGNVGGAGKDFALAVIGTFVIADGAELGEYWVHPAYVNDCTIVDNRS